MLRFILTTFIAVAALACAAPAEVSGEVEGRPFTLVDVNPELIIGDLASKIVIAEEDGKTLKTLVIYIGNDLDLVVGEPVALGDDVRIVLSEGELAYEKDGEVVNAPDPEFFDVVKGEVVFDSLKDPVAGSFWLELADGSIVEGTFVLDGEL